jgi:hypothetical protein
MIIRPLSCSGDGQIEQALASSAVYIDAKTNSFKYQIN